jgi:hypothetical protein
MKKWFISLALACPFVASAELSVTHISLIFQGVKFVHSNYVPKEMTVKATGVGDTQQVAIENALNVAVQKSVGVLILSEQSVSNDTVVRNLVAQYSSGVVNSYTITSCGGSPVVCEITAIVSPLKFMRKLQGDSNTVEVKGGDLFAKHLTSKNTLLQREKMTEYYLQHIRQSGLQANVKHIDILPNAGEHVSLDVAYEIVWEEQFKNELIGFLRRLQKDTMNMNAYNQVYVQWGTTSFFDDRRVHINAHSPHYRSMFVRYVYSPVYVKIEEFDVCQRINVESVFDIGWHKMEFNYTVKVDPNKLKNLSSVTVKIGC